MNRLERFGRAQLHIHTDRGDGLATTQRLLEKAVDLGMDLIAFTNHDQFTNIKQARELALRNNWPIQVIPGIEITASLCFDHILAFFPEEIPEYTTNEMFMGVEKTVDWIHANNGVAILAHPRASMFFIKNPHKCHIFDGFELITPVNGKEGNNPRVDKFYHHSLYQDVAPIGSGDIHHLNARGWNHYTLFPGTTTKEFVEAIKTCRTVPYRDNFNLLATPWSDIFHQSIKAVAYDPIKTKRLYRMLEIIRHR